MPIVGITHTPTGAIRMRRTVTTKIAIGTGPSGNRNQPAKLDHFVILSKGFATIMKDGKKYSIPSWIPDEEKTKHYGAKPKRLRIVFHSNLIDEVFRSELAAWNSCVNCARCVVESCFSGSIPVSV
jgi:hypothetical protein